MLPAPATSDRQRRAGHFVHNPIGSGKGDKAATLERLMKFLMIGLVLAGSSLPGAPPSPLLDTLASELERNFSVLKEKADPPAYFISYEVTDSDSHAIEATLGDISSHSDSHSRVLDVSLRAGTPKLDNYHLIGGEMPRFAASVAVPIEGGTAALKQLAWIETDRAYRAAAERLIRIKTSEQVRRSEERRVGKECRSRWSPDH